MIIIENTPIEQYQIGKRTVFVKREDLSTIPPAPPFSKCRGLYAKMLKLQEGGITTVGYTETPISMAGWAVAWCAKQLGMRCVIFDPQLKKINKLLIYHREQWKKFEPDIVRVPAGRYAIERHKHEQILHKGYPNAIMLPLGISFQESIEETAKEWQRTMKHIRPDYTILCVGSGTIMAGILHGLQSKDGALIGVLCSERKKVSSLVWLKSGRMERGVFGINNSVQFVKANWRYTDFSKIKSPFPCHPYYDLKAWQWLVEHINKFPKEKKILFWNIGSMPNYDN